MSNGNYTGPKIDYSDILGSGEKSYNKSKKDAESHYSGPTIDYTDLLGPGRVTGDLEVPEYFGGISEKEVQKRIKKGYGFMRDSGFDPFGKPDSLMALADIALVGVPTFGDKKLEYKGRTELRDLVMKSKNPGYEVENWIESNFGPGAKDQYIRLNQEIGKPFRDHFKGVAIPEAFPFQSALGRLPEIIRGAGYGIARQLPMALTGDGGKEDWRTNLDEIEGIAKKTAATRAADGTVRLLQYFVPYIGQATAVSDTFQMLDRSTEIGIPAAFKEEILGTLEGINVFEPGLEWDERLVRGLGLAVAAAGVAHGAKRAKGVLDSIKAGLPDVDAFGFGKIMTDALELSFQSDPQLASFLSGKDTVGNRRLKGDPAEGVNRVNHVTGDARAHIKQAAETLAAQGGEVASFWTRVIERQGEEPDRGIMDIATEESTKPEWSHLDPEAVKDSAPDMAAPIKKLKTANANIVSQYNTSRNRLIQGNGEQKLKAGEEALWRNGETDQPVTLLGLAGEKDGVRYWSVEGSTTGIPESELLPAPRKVRGNKVTAEDIALARTRLDTGGVIPGETTNSPAFPRSGSELADTMRNRFMMGDRDAEAIAGLYEARASTWAERTGNSVGDWFNDRFVGFGDADTIFRHEDLNRQIKYADQDGVIHEARLMQLEGDEAWVKRGNQSEEMVNRLDIQEGLIRDMDSVPRLEPTGTRTPNGATVIRLDTYGTDEAFFELTGDAQKQYLKAEADYTHAVRISQNQSLGGPQRIRAAGMEFARFKREITGRLTGKELQERAKKEETAGAGKQVISPDGPGESLGVTHGRIRVRLGDGSIGSYARADIEVPSIAGTLLSARGVKELTPADLKGRRLEGDPLGKQVVGRGVKGFTDFVENGRAIVRAFSAADPTTFLHELAHVMRREIYMGSEFTPIERRMLEDWAGAKDGQWHVDAEEKWARGVERYVLDGKSPTRALGKVFARMKTWLKKVYSKIEGSEIDVDVSPTVAELLDKVFGKDIDKKKIKQERLEQIALRSESEAISRRREELLMIEPDDPRIDMDDPYGDHDMDLIQDIQNTLGAGPEDPRKPGEIIEDAREAEMQASAMEQIRQELLDTNDAGNTLAWVNEHLVKHKDNPGGTSADRAMWIATKGKDGNLNIDHRRPVNMYYISDWPENAVKQAMEFLHGSYNGPNYFLLNDSQVRSHKTGDKVRNLMNASELMGSDEGFQFVTKDFLVKFREYLRDQAGTSTEAPTRLYQKEDAEDAKNGGLHEALFNERVDDMTFWAAEVLGELDGNIDELKKLIRKEFGTDGMQTLEIVRRINELVPIERIIEVNDEFGGSYKAITQMLLDEFPELPRSRHNQAVDRALKLSGRKMATVPRMKVDPKTKRKEPIAFKDVLLIGGEDLMVPAKAFEGISTWASHLPSFPNSYTMERFLERVVGRDHFIIEYLVKNRQEAVTNLTNHLQDYSDRLTAVYGDLLHDKEARKYVMFTAEGKGEHVSIDGLKAWRPVLDGLIDGMISDGVAHSVLKREVERAGLDWHHFLKGRKDATYETFAELVTNQKVKDEMLRVAETLSQNNRFRNLVDTISGGKSFKVIFNMLLESSGRKPFDAGNLKELRPNDWQQIINIAEWHRNEYDALFKDVNAVRKRFGLGEIPYRRDYMTHMAEEASTWRRLSGVDPTDPTGNRHARPNSIFNRYALQRKGERSNYDSLMNFEAYLDTTLRQIHLTEPAVRHRAVARIIQRKDLEGQWKDVSNYINNAANELVSKEVFGDLDIKSILGDTRRGQTIENVVSWTSSRFARNTIVGNLQSAVMQTAQLPIAAGMVGPENVAGAVKARVAFTRAGVDPSMQSPFLTRRYGYKGKLAVDWFEQANRFLGKPMEFIEEQTGRTIWTAAHLQAEKAGKSGNAAIEYADKITERMLGGRAIGEKSPIFNTKYGQLLLQFQYEVSNFNQMIRHDLPYMELEGRNLTRKEMLGRAAVMAVSIHAMNYVYEFLFGRRPLPDAIETTLDLGGILVDPNSDFGEKSLRSVGRFAGELASATAGGSVVGGILPETGAIFGTGLSKQELFGNTSFGQFSGGAPITGGIERMTSSESPGEFAWNVTTTLGLPGGGSQIRKTVDGLRASWDGKVYDKKGKVRFEVDGADKFRATIFGTYATGEGQSWLEARREKTKQRKAEE